MAITTIDKRTLWAGRIISALPVLFLLLDAIMKLVKPPFVVEATVQLGYPESVIVGIGIVLLACTILYLIPRTAVLGAILLTGYLGGAIATHVRVGGPLFNIIFPVILGAMVWGGLYLRDQRVRRLHAHPPSPTNTNPAQ
jgi:DoxX-like family